MFPTIQVTGHLIDMLCMINICFISIIRPIILFTGHLSSVFSPKKDSKGPRLASKNAKMPCASGESRESAGRSPGIHINKSI